MDKLISPNSFELAEKYHYNETLKNITGHFITVIFCFTGLQHDLQL